MEGVGQHTFNSRPETLEEWFSVYILNLVIKFGGYFLITVESIVAKFQNHKSYKSRNTS